MRHLLTASLIAIQSVYAFGQVESMSYEDANPGALHVYISTTSDSAYLRSFIRSFDETDIVRIKKFLNSSFVAENRNPPDKYGQQNQLLLDSLDNILMDRRSICFLTAGDTADMVFNTALENEITRPLILLVDQNHDRWCQMAVSRLLPPPEERLRKLMETERKQTTPNTH